MLSRYQADAWRYVLTALAPETGDVDFTWDDFLEKVNNELVANWGNLANRILGFRLGQTHYDGKIPCAGTARPHDDEAVPRRGEGRLRSRPGELFDSGDGCAPALEEARRLSTRVNGYLNDKAPWTTVKTDPARAQTTVWVALQCITWLKTMWAPILPESSQLIHEALGFDGKLFGRQYRETVTEPGGASHVVLRYDHGAGAVAGWQAVTLPRAWPMPCQRHRALPPSSTTRSSRRRPIP